MISKTKIIKKTLKLWLITEKWHILFATYMQLDLQLYDGYDA